MAPKPVRVTGTDLPKCHPSIFTLTFALEVVGIDVFHDCNEGMVDIGTAPVQGLKLQYQLAPGQNFTIEVLIWPHTAKILNGTSSVWVRTWFFLQRRWLAFSVAHLLPVRVEEFSSHIVTVVPAFGVGNISSGAKVGISQEVYFPKIVFGERRQFAPVMEEEISLVQYLIDLIWSLVLPYIPSSILDGPFNVLHLVTDKRHQDAVIKSVQEAILEREPKDKEMLIGISKMDTKGKPKKPEVSKYEIMLTGDQIICGTGRITKFDTVGERPQDAGEVIVLIASACLPAPDDKPVIFVNVGQLTDIPFNEFLKCNISEIYVKWTINDNEHVTQPQSLNHTVDFDDHHAVPLPVDMASEIISKFLDTDYRIQLRGIRSLPPTNVNPNLFGYAKGDRDFPSFIPAKVLDADTDILIGTTKITVKSLLHKSNALIRGEYPIYPLQVKVKELERDRICTNDINSVREPLVPEIIVPTEVILTAQMTLDVCIGLVGCKPHKTTTRYSRLYDLVSDTNAIMAVLNHITEINEEVIKSGNKEDLLSGFALDTGETVLLYVEGPRDRQILHVWEMTADFYPQMKPIFSSSLKYSSRLYPDFIKGAVPFLIMKMFVPLSVLLACPPIYASPALPAITRHAVLKLGRLLTSKRNTVPDCTEMPTTAEISSFRLELCIAPRPPSIVPTVPEGQAKVEEQPAKTTQISQKINFEASTKRD